MNEPCESEICGSVPHAYLSAWAMWCGHRQAWTVSWTLYQDSGLQDDARVVASGYVPLGPFDDTADALRLLVGKLEELAPTVTTL